MGTLESYTYRDDARKNNVKSEAHWKKRAFKQLGGLDDEIRPWFDGFVGLVGKSEAEYLLEGAGVLASKGVGKVTT